MGVCGGCGISYPDGAKFCAECGSPLTSGAPAVPIRKTVTVVFCDVTGSTSLGETRDPETLRAVMTLYFAAMGDVLEHHGGTVEKFIGDAVVAVFGVPVVHEDDALRAVRAAVQMQERLADLNGDLEGRFGTRLSVRIGVNTGEVVVGEAGSSTVATGNAVNIAARLEQAAAPGEVLIGLGTWQLVRAAVDAESIPDLVVKGKADPVAAWRVRSAAGPEVARPMAATRLVGRVREMTLLNEGFDRCVADRVCQLTTLLGAPGVGKTRLSSDFLSERTTAAVVHRGRCLPYGDVDGMWPLREVLRSAAGLRGDETEAMARQALARLAGNDADGVAERLAPIAGYGGASPPVEEIGWAFRRVVEISSRRRPWIVLVDDVHWASQPLLDVIEHVVEWSVDSPAMLLCLGRPELLDSRPHWGGGQVNAVTMTLQPLSESETGELIDDLLVGGNLSAAAAGEIRRASGGLPLFVEQMVAMLAEDDAGGGVVHVPPTITALLAARLERLSPDERTVLEVASIMGQLFYIAAVDELTAAPGVRHELESLVRKEFLRPAASDLPGQDAVGFRHALVRDTVYGTLSKGRRAELHERFGRWLEKRGETLAIDLERFVVHHLSTAIELRDELGPRDDSGRELAVEVTARMSRLAGQLDQSDSIAAAGLLERAADLADDPLERLALQVTRIRIALDTEPEQLDRCLRITEAAASEASTAGSERFTRIIACHRRRLQTQLGVAKEPLGFEPAIALQEFDAEGDHEGVIAASLTLITDLQVRDAWTEMIPYVESLRETAERLRDVALIRQVAFIDASCIMFGQQPIESCIDRLEEMNAETREPRLKAIFLRTEGPLLAMAGRTTAARAAIAEAERIMSEFGLIEQPVLRAFTAGLTEILLEDGAAAAAAIQPGIDSLAAQGEISYHSTLLYMLAEARLLQDDPIGARESAEVCRQITPADDTFSQSGWRMVLSELALADGDVEGALSLAAEALQWQLQGDQLHYRGIAYTRLAKVLLAVGRRDEARSSLESALTCFDQRGVRILSSQVRKDLSQFEPDS